ncbi:MAG: bifunctional UDP-sugar hydrolase/5'-nucleotidase [Clostridia bacterium]|nr:bifunctional UDP-sugar hydrolase/5'-nucleotidase [Clostridia bacterium]
MKRFICVLMTALLLLAALPVTAAGGEKSVRIFFTHDIHSYFMATDDVIDGKLREHGGAARLKTLLSENRTENSVYVDAGDFSMGTLLQAGFSTDAYELRLLGELGCDFTTFGNHEFDYGDEALAEMLAAAKKSGDKLPKIVQSNMNYSDSDSVLSDAMKDYGAQKYSVMTVGGVKLAVFGLFGIDSLECTPTTKMEVENYIEAAKSTVKEIKEEENPDLILCLSHSGTEGDGKCGEDIELAKKVPDIDVIISGHSHTEYAEPATVGETIIVSAGEYLSFLGMLDVTVGDGGVECTRYKLLSCDETVEEDSEIAAKVNEYKERIDETYLRDEGVSYDEVICRSEFDFMTVNDMYSAHQEYPFGNLIADSYIYEAKRNGIDDIDVALVALGTVRNTFGKGDITTADAFEVCSLGVGSDGSAGHPIVSAYITGKELKLLTELDASMGPMVSYIKMSYSGLSYTFNTKRIILDKVTDVYLVREGGTREEIEDEKLYRVACNMYAANMLGMLNGMTYGILKITPKNADGTPVENFYDCALKDSEGREIKEWSAFKNYLMSMPEKDELPTITEKYSEADGRKNKISEGGFAAVANPGFTTAAVMAICAVLIAVVLTLILTRKKRKARRERRKNRKISG